MPRPDTQAARWATLAHTDTNWVDGYASAVEWRGLDPRAATAADRIENALRQAGIDVPDTTTIQVANRQAAAAVATGAGDTTDSGLPEETEPPSKIGVTMATRPADEVELGQKSHPTQLSTAGRPQRRAGGSTYRPGHGLDRRREWRGPTR